MIKIYFKKGGNKTHLGCSNYPFLTTVNVLQLVSFIFFYKFKYNHLRNTFTNRSLLIKIVRIIIGLLGDDFDINSNTISKLNFIWEKKSLTYKITGQKEILIIHDL